MQFDLFYECSLPPNDPRDETTLYQDVIAEIQLGESLGFSTAWLVEHHFMRHYSHSSAPELLLAALSQQTQSINLGHAIVPLPYHHPVQIAERLATLDQLSNGRIAFGYGRGFSPKEYQTFGASMANSRSLTAEALAIIRQAVQGERINFTGEHYDLTDLDIVPASLQKNAMPFWSAAVSPDSYELAAENGDGVLIGPFKPWFMIKEDIKRYRQHWQRFHGDSQLTHLNPRVGMTVGIFVHPDSRRAHELAKPAFEWFYGNLLKQTQPVLEKLYDSYEYYRRFGHFSGLLSKTVNLTLLETLGMAIVGTPDQCIKKLKKLEQAGVDNVIFAVGAGAMPTELVRQTMQLLHDEVLPAFGHQ